MLKAIMMAMMLMAPTLTAAAQTAPRVLVLVTSVDRFPDGRQTGTWLEEFAVPYTALVHAGAQVSVVSPHGGPAPIDPHSAARPEQAQGWQKAIEALHATRRLDASIDTRDYDAIFIPGGHGPLFDLATDPAVAGLISSFARAAKPVASVCHGPASLLGVTLADGTPLVRGKKMTAFSDAEEKAAGLSAVVPFSLEQRLAALGARYTQGPNFAPYAVADGGLVTGQNPASSQKVAELLLAALQNKVRP